MQFSDCAVLVPSCDKYGDLWKPFFSLLFRYWSDCPYPIYLSSNSAAYEDPRVTTLATGHADWSSELTIALTQLRTRYVLLLLEDFFLRKSVSTGAIERVLNRMQTLDAAMLRLTPCPGPTLPIIGVPEIGYVEPGSPYRVNLQATIWRRTDLMKLLRAGESVWDFEIRATVRSCATPANFLCCWLPVIDYGQHVVERGKWFRHQARRYRATGIGCDFSHRDVLSIGVQIRWRLNRLRNMLLLFLPWRRRLQLMRYFHRGD